MILRYGSYFFAENSVTPSYFGAHTIYSERARPLMLRKRAVFDGEIVATGSLAIATEMAAIQAALALDGGDVIWLGSDGGGWAMPSGSSLDGVRVVERPSFTAQDGRAHWVTGLPFRFAFEGNYPTVTDGIVSYTETITAVGDGRPRQVCVELDTGLPEIQTVSSSTPIVVVQSGEINGFLGYASVNTPIFPSAILAPEDKQISETAPRLFGNTYTDFNRRWTYRMTLTSASGIPSPLAR